MADTDNIIKTTYSGTRAELKHSLAQGKKASTAAQGKGSYELVEHNWDAEAVANHHKTDLAKGLTSEQVSAKVAQYGYNELTPPKTTPWYCLFFQHLTGFFSLLLWLAAVLCYIAYGLDQKIPENLYLGIVLTIVVILTGVFSFYQDYQSAAVMKGFKNMLPPLLPSCSHRRAHGHRGSRACPG
jgi:sodium/potassium-transporting ATPase subunit alpha